MPFSRINDLPGRADGVALAGPDHRFVFVSPAFADLVGRRPEDLVGRTFDDITHSDDARLDDQLARRLYEGGMSGYEMEKRYLDAAGRPVPVHMTVSPVRDHAGAVLYAMAVVRPVAKASVAKPRTDALNTADAELDRIRRAIIG